MRILGIDYGRARLGLAVSDEQGKMALPLMTLPMHKPLVAFEQIRRIIGEKEINLIVVGLPLNLSMGETEETKRARIFAEALRDKFAIKVDFENELLSSRLFEERPKRAKAKSKQKTKSEGISLDDLAAADILQRYLDRRAMLEREESQDAG